MALKPGRRSVLLTGLLMLAGCGLDRPKVAATGVSGTPADGAQAAAGDIPLIDAPHELNPASGESDPESRSSLRLTRDEIIATYGGQTGTYWGLEAPGVLSRLTGSPSGVALTFDFCGGPNGNDVDAKLVTVLRKHGIPATLFLNARWITANRSLTKELAADPLFELANHGTLHRPLSTSGQSAYGLSGTKNAGEIYDEVMTNSLLLAELTGRWPLFFRPGTAYLDEVSTQIVRALGLTPVGFSINGDAGATLPAQAVAREISRASANDIVIAHANHPHGGTAEGLTRALAVMKARGENFLHLQKTPIATVS